jgi:hypothetical protein
MDIDWSTEQARCTVANPALDRRSPPLSGRDRKGRESHVRPLDVDELGPVDWIVVEFPGSTFDGERGRREGRGAAIAPPPRR